MKTVKQEEMRREYSREELGVGVRGKHYREYEKGTNLILLSPDVAGAFPDDVSVNNALRGLLEVSRQYVRFKSHRRSGVKALKSI